MKINILAIIKLAVLITYCTFYSQYAYNAYKNVFQAGPEDSLAAKGIKYIEHVVSASKNYGIDPALIVAIIHAESNFNPRAHSYAGAKGLMQLNDVTARHVNLKNVYDPLSNINAGTRYLKELFSIFGNNLNLVIAAYNAGPGAVKRYQGIPPYKETRNYVVKVRALINQYKSSTVNL